MIFLFAVPIYSALAVCPLSTVYEEETDDIVCFGSLCRANRVALPCVGIVHQRIPI